MEEEEVALLLKENSAPTVTPNTGILLGTKDKICLEIPPIPIEGMIKCAI